MRHSGKDYRHGRKWQEAGEDKIIKPNRSEAEFLPPRDDVRKRFKKKDMQGEDKADYKDTLSDKDLQSSRSGRR